MRWSPESHTLEHRVFPSGVECSRTFTSCCGQRGSGTHYKQVPPNQGTQGGSKVSVTQTRFQDNRRLPCHQTCLGYGSSLRSESWEGKDKETLGWSPIACEMPLTSPPLPPSFHPQRLNCCSHLINGVLNKLSFAIISVKTDVTHDPGHLQNATDTTVVWWFKNSCSGGRVVGVRARVPGWLLWFVLGFHVNCLTSKCSADCSP